MATSWTIKFTGTSGTGQGQNCIEFPLLSCTCPWCLCAYSDTIVAMGARDAFPIPARTVPYTAVPYTAYSSLQNCCHAPGRDRQWPVSTCDCSLYCSSATQHF